MNCKLLYLRLRPLLGCVVGIITASFAACGGGGDAAPVSSPVAQSPEPPLPPTAVQPVSGFAWQGHYVGTVTIDGTQYFGDALLTGDGAVRLYVGGPYADTGALQFEAAPNSMQLVGTLAPAPQSHASGQGLVLGEHCALSNPGRFCQLAGSASIDISIASGNLEGEVSVLGAQGGESWSLQLGAWADFKDPAWVGYLVASYKEQIAEFAVSDDTLIHVQSDGTLSFQGPHSGCSGSGTIGTRGGVVVAVNVYDVHITVSGCSGAYSYLNGDYQGLATDAMGTVWDYSDTWLRMWLSQNSPPGTAVPAFTTLASMQ